MTQVFKVSFWLPPAMLGINCGWEQGKWKQEDQKEALGVDQMRGENDGSGLSEKCPDLGYVLKIQAKGLPAGLNVKCAEKRKERGFEG